MTGGAPGTAAIGGGRRGTAGRYLPRDRAGAARGLTWLVRPAGLEDPLSSLQPGRRHVVFLNWRDTLNPEGGGSERYVERVAEGLAARGWRVTVCCARHGRAPADEVRAGVRYRRRGSKTAVYPAALVALVLRRLGRVDAVVDVQNGVPFLARVVARRTLVLVHHVHREQWPVVYGPLGARLGWWIESRLTPWVYRHSSYVAVSEATRDDLASVGVDRERIVVVRNGIEHPPVGDREPASVPRVCVLGRLVPHKQVEHAIDAVAALRTEIPGVHLDVVGDGWWRPQLQDYAGHTGGSDVVTFHGTVSESRKHELLSSAWVLALPSLKEGWGLVVQEAALHSVPAVGYRAAGGVAESILDGRTGLLADSPAELTAALRRLLTDEALRTRLGTAAQQRSATFDWDRTVKEFAAVVEAVVHDGARPGRPSVVVR